MNNLVGVYHVLHNVYKYHWLHSYKGALITPTFLFRSVVPEGLRNPCIQLPRWLVAEMEFKLISVRIEILCPSLVSYTVSDIALYINECSAWLKHGHTSITPSCLRVWRPAWAETYTGHWAINEAWTATEGRLWGTSRARAKPARVISLFNRVSSFKKSGAWEGQLIMRFFYLAATYGALTTGQPSARWSAHPPRPLRLFPHCTDALHKEASVLQLIDGTSTALSRLV